MLELARSPLGYKLHIHELIPKADQYPSDWNDWKVDHERDYPEPKEESVEKIPFDLETKSWPLFETSTVKVCAGKRFDMLDPKIISIYSPY